MELDSLLDGRPEPRPTWRHLVGDLAHLIDVVAPGITSRRTHGSTPPAITAPPPGPLLEALELAAHRPDRLFLFATVRGRLGGEHE